MSHIFRPADYERTKRKRASGTSHDDRSRPSPAPTVLVNSESPESVCSSPVPPRRVFVELPIPRTHLNLCSPRPTELPAGSANPGRSPSTERDPSQGCSKSAGAARVGRTFFQVRRIDSDRGGEKQGDSRTGLGGRGSREGIVVYQQMAACGAVTAFVTEK